MTGGFEEWAAARTPSLLAFASALTDDERASDAAVTQTLARLRSTWSQVGRDDPELEARRQVARRCATPRRAAVALRVLEERSDREIAEVLGCSEAAARRHVQRGLEDVDRHGNLTTASARDHLVARAGSAPTQLLTRPPETAVRDEPARRHRSAWLAALAVVTLIGGVAYVEHESSAPDGVITYPRVEAPETWRAESYAGVQVQVPNTWGWGASPVRSGYFDGPRHLGGCGTTQAAVLSPTDDAAYVSSLTGFVGRPAVLDRRCVDWGADGSVPRGDALWFDSPLGVGVQSIGGNVAETRQVGDQHVTVFSSRADLRREILGTAQRVDVDDHGCPTRPVSRATEGPADLAPTSLSVCVYSQDSGAATLMWSGTVPEHAARAYTKAAADFTGDGSGVCSPPTGSWAALGVRGGDGVRWDVVNLGCARIQLAGHASVPLVTETVRSWAYGGATAYLSAPTTARELTPYFSAPSG
jgi:Sigma-70, region 4